MRKMQEQLAEAEAAKTVEAEKVGRGHPGHYSVPVFFFSFFFFFFGFWMYLYRSLKGCS